MEGSGAPPIRFGVEAGAAKGSKETPAAKARPADNTKGTGDEILAR
jgi:hypothetical protein